MRRKLIAAATVIALGMTMTTGAMAFGGGGGHGGGGGGHGGGGFGGGGHAMGGGFGGHAIGGGFGGHAWAAVSLAAASRWTTARFRWPRVRDGPPRFWPRSFRGPSLW